MLAQFVWSEVQVYEKEGAAEICASKNVQTIVDLTLDLVAHNGNATGTNKDVVTMLLYTLTIRTYHSSQLDLTSTY